MENWGNHTSSLRSQGICVCVHVRLFICTCIYYVCVFVEHVYNYVYVACVFECVYYMHTHMYNTYLLHIHP